MFGNSIKMGRNFVTQYSLNFQVCNTYSPSEEQRKCSEKKNKICNFAFCFALILKI